MAEPSNAAVYDAPPDARDLFSFSGLVAIHYRRPDYVTAGKKVADRICGGYCNDPGLFSGYFRFENLVGWKCVHRPASCSGVAIFWNIPDFPASKILSTID